MTFKDYENNGLFYVDKIAELEYKMEFLMEAIRDHIGDRECILQALLQDYDKNKPKVWHRKWVNGVLK